MFFKNECFKIEREYRIVFSIFLEDDCKLTSLDNELLFRENNGIFIPYIAVKFKKDSLIGITISPTLDEEQTKQSIKRMVGAGYFALNKEGAITVSKIPVRY